MAAATLSTLSTLLDLLAKGELVLLPNARAARALRAHFDVTQQARGLTAWEPANALAWFQWTASLYNDLIVSGNETRLLLNQVQEHNLWRDIIAANHHSSPDALADLASAAWQLAASHNATTKLRATAASHDSRIFADWAEAFTKRCLKENLLSPSLLDAALAETWGAPGPDSRTRAATDLEGHPKTLHLAGFLDLTPAQDSLLTALTATGTTVHHHTLQTTPNLQAQILAPSERDELTQAAHWLRDFLQTSRQPTAVAVLVPNLTDDRANLESTFREVLAPELQSITADLSSTPWEFSTGTPLASLPLIAAALDLAHWSASQLPLNRISTLLLSPYVGTPADRDLGARFDATILRRAQILRPEADLRTLLSIAIQQSKRATAPDWLQHLQQAISRAGDLTRPRTFADWTEFFRTLTAAANWPGPRCLNATEFAATRAWDSTLDTIATLDFSGRRVALAEAVAALTRQARETVFRPPTTNAPIQIMSPEDSAGSLFDAVLFLRATDRNWPPAARPNPLLPWQLQQSLRMPGTDPALDTARARTFTDDLLNRTQNLIFTSAAETPDGPQQPSPLIPSNLPILNLELRAEPQLITTEQHPDNAPLPPLPDNIAGGTRILKLQAACGFLAFAELRLNSAPLNDKSAGLDALEAGNVLHLALEKFWRLTKSQEELRNMTRESRAERLTQCIEAAIPRYLRIDTDWDKAYLAVQKERLLQVLQDWLESELQRGPFTVLDSERNVTITIGPIDLNARIDRIDRVEGGFFLVDYKTGSAANPKHWVGDRPEEPQLPLYALLYEPGELKGLAFAKVRAGKGIEWRGYQADLGLLPAQSKIVDIELAIDEWRNTLAALARDFANGVTHVNPKDFAVNCKRCAQRLLCRINPEAFLAQSDSDEDETGGGDE